MVYKKKWYWGSCILCHINKTGIVVVVACSVSVSTVDREVSTGLALCSNVLQRMTSTEEVVYCAVSIGRVLGQY